MKLSSYLNAQVEANAFTDTKLLQIVNVIQIQMHKLEIIVVPLDIRLLTEDVLSLNVQKDKLQIQMVFAKQRVKIMQKSSRQETTHAFAAVTFIKITSIVQSAVMPTIHGMKHPKRAYKKAPEKGAFFLQKNK